MSYKVMEGSKTEYCNFCKQHVLEVQTLGIFHICPECKKKHYNWRGVKKPKWVLKTMQIGTLNTPPVDKELNT